ncbi:tellurite resistance TerB family protein [Aliishimia ponticola]|uniref:Tellurite resistance TerB family protein n=1 Tax=Aliishimia ponticola TaxID=2499833 RepID=A0A4S4NFP4_9RHOB|nr:tellurite resistance TerB family protein [Aliishimia ponticola]THH38426.1 tellurite resistance TerB family protein [Aliishimia ponticola]
MSLVKTLAKVAVGVAIAKGASSLMKGSANSGAGQVSGGGGGLGDMLKNMMPPNAGTGTAYGGANSPAGGGIEDMLGGLLGGGAAGGGLGQGGLGGLLDQISGGTSGKGGNLQDLLSGLAGGGAAAGGLGKLLGGLTGQPSAPETAGFGEVLNSQFEETPVAAIEPSADQEAAAALMLRAMIQAAKSDGSFDADEQAKLIERLGGDVDASERAFVEQELAKPVDVDALVQDTPKALAPQVYAMSLLGIDLDTQPEAQYLHQLAQGFGLDAATVNAVHEQMGVPALYQ